MCGTILARKHFKHLYSNSASSPILLHLTRTLALLYLWQPLFRHQAFWQVCHYSADITWVEKGKSLQWQCRVECFFYRVSFFFFQAVSQMSDPLRNSIFPCLLSWTAFAVWKKKGEKRGSVKKCEGEHLKAWCVPLTHSQWVRVLLPHWTKWP